MGDVASEPERHQVQLFENATRLGEQVADFLGDALRAGGAAVLIARAEHVRAADESMRARGLDLHDAVQAGRFHVVDAEQLFEAIFVNQRIDRRQFAAKVASLIGELTSRGGPVHVYSEIVDLLWARGHADAMLELELGLEHLWGEVLARMQFSLLCGYRIGAFDRNTETFDKVLAAHDCAHASEAGRVTQLQQRANALQSEIDRRQRLERLMTQLFDVAAELAHALTREDIARATIASPGFAGARSPPQGSAESIASPGFAGARSPPQGSAESIASPGARSPPQGSAESIARGALPLDAAAIAIWTVAADGEHLELLDASPGVRTGAARYQRVPISGDTPVARAVRTNTRAVLGSLEENAAIVPLAIGDVRFGCICFTYPREPIFDEAETNYQTLLARHCASALARVESIEQERAQREAAIRAVAAEKQARGDIELLYELIASFNRIDHIDAVHELALESVQRISRSDRAAILLLDHAGVMRFRASAGLSDRYRDAVEGHSPWRPDDACPAPIVVDDAETDPAWADYRSVFAAEGIRALAFVPIVHQRRLIGKFMLYRNEARAFTPRDLQLTATVAVHVAQAVERKQQERELARAYREEREAHLLAEEAARAREEILSVVSHDLRNPLGTIMMGASTLLTAKLDDKGQRVRTTADRIHRQAERMARLIEELVDFAGIQAGLLALQRGRHAPHDILSTTHEIFGPIANERGLRLETEVTINLPPVECDSDRAVQVLSNLVSNALKVTPKGGQIAIGASPSRFPHGSVTRTSGDGGEIVFYVSDSGPGIDPAELPNLFERHWRGKESAPHRGIGLGLSIARGIVDAHGGRIWAESRTGGGTTFFFSLSPSPG